MLQNPLTESWDRIPSLDGLVETLSQSIEQLKALYLGQASDGVPIFAFADKESKGPRLLVVAGGAGDSVIGLPAAVSLLQELAGYETWIICGLDAARLRHNDSQLGSLSPSLADHAFARRLPWGPGEDPERNLPVDYENLYQPDQQPQGYSCSEEALALARAINHLQPKLVLSLKDLPAGGATIASSQELLGPDWQALTASLEASGLAMQLGPSLIDGLLVKDHPGCMVLGSLQEESRRFAGQLAAGPVPVWQALTQQSPGAVYLSLHLPRFWAEQLGDLSACDQLRSVEVSHETRLLRGREENTRVVRLLRPGHPADKAEVRVEKAVEGEQLGLIENSAVQVGWLAVEAMLERQALLTEALRGWQEVADHMEGQDFERGMQVLLAAGEIEPQLKAAQGKSDAAAAATQADWCYWDQVYRYETSLLLSESLRCLRGESKTDPRINDLRDQLQAMIEQNLALTKSLKPIGAQKLSQASADWAKATAQMVLAGGPDLVQAGQRLEAARSSVSDCKREARSARHLKLGPAERAEADRQLESAESELNSAQEALALMEQSTGTLYGDPQESSQPETAHQAPEPPAAEPVHQAPEPPAAEPVHQAPEPPAAEPVHQAPEPPAAEPVHQAPEPPAAEPVHQDPEPPAELPAEPQATEPVHQAPEAERPLFPEPPAELPVEPQATEPVHQAPELQEESQASPPEASLDSDQLPKLPDPPQPKVEPARVRTSAAGEDAVELDPPEIAVEDSSTWFIGPDQGRVELNKDIDIEPMLPPKLDIPPEWGLGPIRWKEHIPSTSGQPMLRRLARHLIGMEQAPAEAAEVEVEDPGLAIEPSKNKSRTAKESRPTGWVRRRAELPGRSQLPPALLPPVPPADGKWREFRRGVS